MRKTCLGLAITLFIHGGVLCTADASSEELKFNMDRSADSVTVSAEMPKKYEAALQKLTDKAYLEGLFENLPGVTKTEFFVDDPPKVVEETKSYKKVVKERMFLFKFLDPKLFPQSLFSVSEEQTICKTTSGCDGQISLTLTGPVHCYSSYVAVSGPTRPELLNGSFEIVIRATMGSASATRMSTKFTFLNRDYLGYIKQLHEKGRLSRIPLETEMQAFFAFWSKEQLKAVAK